LENIIIRGGVIMDGTGASGWKGDVEVRNGAITRIGDLTGVFAEKELNANGLVVAPGFIDAHAHSDTAFLKDDSGASKLYQGITTEVTGQCGSSPFPAKEDPAEMEKLRRCGSFRTFTEAFENGGYAMAVNQAMLVGHGSLRRHAVGYEDRAATRAEMEQMKTLLRQDMADGAWGMSLGLEYSPGFFAGAEELQELGAVVREYDGVVTCHMRNEGLKIEEAIDELLGVGRASGVHVHVSHLKIDNFRAHGRAAEIWKKLECARATGVNVTEDMYPFTASCTGLSIRCPKWSQEGGDEALVERLTGPRRGEIVEGIRSHYFSAERAETCLINDDGGLWPEIVGKTLRYIAENLLHTTDYAQAAAEILLRTKGQAGGIFFVMSEEDMLYFLGQDIGIGSDGYALPEDSTQLVSQPHPRSYGAITEFFRLAREKRLCTTEEAVRRVTGKAADMLGMQGRGRLATGAAADITIFDPESIAPRGTYLAPAQVSQGVIHVLVNGGIALENGRQTPYRGGRFLKKR